MSEENKDLVTGEPNSDEAALLSELASDEVTGEQKAEGVAAEVTDAKPEQPAAPAEEASPGEDPVKALEAKLAEAEKRIADAEKRTKAAQDKMFKALTEANAKRGTPKAEPKDDVPGGQEDGDESDEVDVLYKKHFQRLSDKYPDSDSSTIRSKASKLAWKEYLDSVADRKARSLIENSPVVKKHEDDVVSENRRKTAEFVSSRPELGDRNSEVYKLTDKLFVEKLALMGAADGVEYVRFHDNGKVEFMPAAHRSLDTKEILESAFYEALGRAKTVQRKEEKKPVVPRGSSGRFEATDKVKFKSEDEFLEWISN